MPIRRYPPPPTISQPISPRRTPSASTKELRQVPRMRGKPAPSRRRSPRPARARQACAQPRRHDKTHTCPASVHSAEKLRQDPRVRDKHALSRPVAPARLGAAYRVLLPQASLPVRHRAWSPQQPPSPPAIFNVSGHRQPAGHRHTDPGDPLIRHHDAPTSTSYGSVGASGASARNAHPGPAFTPAVASYLAPASSTPHASRCFCG